MSRLAHSTYAAPGFKPEKTNQKRNAQAEIIEAKKIQKQVGCSWSEALRLTYITKR
jgi:hypothetical protein